MKYKLRRCLLPLLLLLFSLSGCVTLTDPESGQEAQGEVVGVVQPGRVLEQTFVSRRPALNGVQIWLKPVQADQVSGVLAFDLYRTGESEPVASTAYSAASVAAADSLVIPVPAHTAPPEQPYTLRIRSDSSPFSIYGSTSAAFTQGEAALNGTPTAGDIALRLTYSYDQAAVLDDLIEMLRSAWLILPLGLALWLPGRALLALGRIDREWDWGERTALSLGLSLASLPVLMTWTTLFGLRWTREALWMGAALLVAWLVYASIRSHREDPQPVPRPRLRLSSLSGALPALALGVIFLGALFVRLAMTRDLAAPAWVDSIHHALITRLILEGGAFPHDYTPFLPAGVANYHSGFHTGAAVFLWLSGLDLARGMLVYGQVLNALVIFPAYLFTRIYTRSQAAGITAALIVGFLTPMPAYYASWGRFTQLGGLLILPAAFALLHSLWASAEPLWKPVVGPQRLLLAALACGGLFLTHYRVAAFLGLLLLAEAVSMGLAWISARTLAWLKARMRPRAVSTEDTPAHPEGLLGAMAIIVQMNAPAKQGPFPIFAWSAAGFLAILLTIPWWPVTLNEMVGPKLHWETGSSAAFSDFSWTFLTTGLGRYSLALAAAGAVWAVLLRRRFVLTLALWVGLLFLAANLGAMGLPGGSYVNNTSVAISLFLPLALLGGYGLGWLGEALSSLLGSRFSTPGRAAPLLLYSAAAISAMVLGGRALVPLLNPATFLFRAADRPALTWIEHNLPAQSTVLINSFSWGYGVFAGQDGGYWIGPLTGRPTFPPPVLYGMDSDTERIRQTSETVRLLMESSRDPAALHALMKENGIEFIYIGARGGTLDSAVLEDSPLFERLYHTGAAVIFQARP